MADKNQTFRVRDLKTGKIVPIHPSMAKSPQWLSENNMVLIEDLKKYENPSVSAADLPPIPPAAPANSSPKPKLI